MCACTHTHTNTHTETQSVLMFCTDFYCAVESVLHFPFVLGNCVDYPFKYIVVHLFD